jgi:hypothetical protein
MSPKDTGELFERDNSHRWQRLEMITSFYYVIYKNNVNLFPFWRAIRTYSVRGILIVLGDKVDDRLYSEARIAAPLRIR